MNVKGREPRRKTESEKCAQAFVVFLSPNATRNIKREIERKWEQQMMHT